MSLKNVLVHVDDSQRIAARIDAAAALARTFEARLTGLYLVPGIDLSSSVATIVPSAVITQRLEEDAQARAAAERFFRTRTEQLRSQAAWSAPTGDPLQVGLLHARSTDLVVLGQHDPANSTAFADQLIATILLGSGRPILMVPYIGVSAPIGRNILIATDDGREAARAIADAMPLLERAQRVEVVMGLRSDESGFELASHRLGSWLADHGIHCRMHPNEADPGLLGELLLSRAADYSSDLIVMGGYGHSRMRELLLGGMTRTILASMTVPVLMSH